MTQLDAVKTIKALEREFLANNQELFQTDKVLFWRMRQEFIAEKIEPIKKSMRVKSV